jgi:hypothetical protein
VSGPAAAELNPDHLGLRSRDVEVTAPWVGLVPRPGALSGEAAIVAEPLAGLASSVTGG